MLFRSDDTATAGSDYRGRSGMLVFAPGQTVRRIGVLVRGDRASEGDETFFVNILSASNATVATARATGTIRNDDALRAAFAAFAAPQPTRLRR